MRKQSAEIVLLRTQLAGVLANEQSRATAYTECIGVIKELSSALERIVMMNECDPPSYSLSHLSIHANDALEATREIRERIGAR